jgi:flagellar hook-length control protein FliK
LGSGQGSGFANMAGIPMSMDVPASLPTSMVPQASPTSAFTVFTPAGRLGQPQKESDDKENDDDEGVEEKNGKKKQPFAVFEAVRVETTRPVQRNHFRQSKEPVSHSPVQQITEKSSKTSEKPKEMEPHPFRSVKTMADILDVPIQNVSVQNVSVQKKGEPNQPNQTQYLHRIAAACEAASQYAPIRMKINLDHLGTLTLRFFYKADKLTLRFDTPSEESARFVRDHLDGLRTILTNRNIKIADMEIYSKTEIN